MAFIRASTVRDLRRKLYHKVLKLPLSFFTDARKGDVMTRISNDVQEIEISVMSSLTMMFRDPMYIIIFVLFLFITSYELTLFALLLLPVSGWLIGRASRTLRSSSLLGQQHLGRLLSVVEETLTGLRIVKGFNAEDKMKAQFAESNERYAKVFQKSNPESISCISDQRIPVNNCSYDSFIYWRYAGTYGFREYDS